jgi:hypothetical protein
VIKSFYFCRQTDTKQKRQEDKIPNFGDLASRIKYPFLQGKGYKKVNLTLNHTIAKKLAIPTGGLLLLLHLSISLTFTFFLHVHTLDTGEKVIHSHPFSATDAEGEPLHQHPGSVFHISADLNCYLDNLSYGQMFLNDNAECFYQLPDTFDLRFRKCPQFLRGPPALV